MTESSTHLVGVAVPTLRQLRSAVLTSTSPDAAVNALREAGFAGGAAVYSAFEAWLTDSGVTAPASGENGASDLSLEEFGKGATQFFRDAGWGDVSLSHDEDEGVAIVDIEKSWEGSASSSSAPGCHITTGLLAAFFGQIAGYPVAVLETECCEGSRSRCRFMMGNADVMNHQWEKMR